MPASKEIRRKRPVTLYSAGLPADGTPILPRLTDELMPIGDRATFVAAILITPALILGIIARDRKEGYMAQF
ncbi:MAG: hypothetical protein LUP97_01575 [Methanoregula sp.]|nr:hypothetical protein [Methanoregula sp.]